jgi:putative aminopeptidase FrvX
MLDDLLERLLRHAPLLTADLDALQADTTRFLEREWARLARLLTAYAPSGGCLLPGAIGGAIADLAAELGLSAHLLPEIGHSGNVGLALGAPIEAVDLVIAAHSDRPSFRVREIVPDGGLLYPVCADRFPDGVYRAGAIALRWEPGQGLIAGAHGDLIAETDGGEKRYRFLNREGQIAEHDLVTLAVPPQVTDGVITGTGLDNSLGVLAALYAARILKSAEGALVAAGRRIVIAFTDLEEGVPTVFFGHGAARLAWALPQPRIGAIVCDAQSANPGINDMGGGVSHGTASAWGRGAYVPPNYHRLAVDLAAALNHPYPNTVQINHGYQSRSDDVALARWTRVLAMIGPPMQHAHTAEETAHLIDVPRAGVWLAAFALACAGVDADLSARYGIRA